MTSKEFQALIMSWRAMVEMGKVSEVVKIWDKLIDDKKDEGEKPKDKN